MEGGTVAVRALGEGIGVGRADLAAGGEVEGGGAVPVDDPGDPGEALVEGRGDAVAGPVVLAAGGRLGAGRQGGGALAGEGAVLRGGGAQDDLVGPAPVAAVDGLAEGRREAARLRGRRGPGGVAVALPCLPGGASGGGRARHRVAPAAAAGRHERGSGRESRLDDASSPHGSPLQATADGRCPILP
ncbi:hypothetical protein GCM10010275_48500 [Streptomyces litmocidini]|nr:hypothetical protein GCM10010275_48500 [Streptomyces litmocidini]